MKRLFLASLGAVLLLSASATTAAEWVVKPVEWTVDKTVFAGKLVYDGAADQTRPGLVMMPNWMGVSDAAISQAKQIAGQDYVVLVADVYGKDVRPSNDDEALAAVKLAYADGGASLRKRAKAAVAALQKQAGSAPLDADKVGVLGFCFGGSVALELARSGADVAGVVSLHGGLQGYRPAADEIKAPILVFNGAEDASVTDAQIAAFKQEMDTAGADWTFVEFSDARHCFMQPEDADNPPDSNCQYNPRAARQALRMMSGFFAAQFKGGEASAGQGGHASRNSLDWAGTYSGVLPCADCPGIEVVVSLRSDGSYARSTRYMDSERMPQAGNGTFAWDESGSKIALDTEDGEIVRFQVGENKLFRLDRDGQRITSSLAAHYVLKKHVHDPAIEGKRWKLVELRGKPVATGQNAVLTLRAEDSVAFGNASCNSFSGKYSIKDGQRIRFSRNMAVTMMACVDMGVESAFLEVLGMADNYSLSDDGMLSLNRARMAPLARFKQEEAAQ